MSDKATKFCKHLEYCEDCKENLKIQLYSLNWSKILYRAIESRRTSWGCNKKECFVITEWRNASDQVLYSLLRELEEKGLVIPLLTGNWKPKES